MDCFKITPDQSAAAIRWLGTMQDRTQWNLTSGEISVLLNIPECSVDALLQSANDRKHIVLNDETNLRIALLLKIYKALKVITPIRDNTAPPMWFTKPINNHLCENKSLKEYLLENTHLDDLVAVYSYLNQYSEG